MKKKTYAEVCIERAKLANEGPWTAAACGDDYRKVVGGSGWAIVIDVSPMDADFIAASRTDVPELAKRLQRACDELRTYSKYVYGIDSMLADELEDMPND